MRNIILIIFLLAVLMSFFSDLNAQPFPYLLNPTHQARYIDGVQAQATFADSAGKFTVVSASIISPLFMIAELNFNGGLGSRKFGAEAVTLGIGHIPFSLGPVHIGWHFRMQELNWMSISGVFGIVTSPFSVNFGYNRILKKDEKKFMVDQPQNSIFANVRISPISWFTIEGEVEGIAKGKPRWDWLKKEAVYHAGVSFEIFSNFYLSGFVFDILGYAERRLGLTYVFSTVKK